MSDSRPINVLVLGQTEDEITGEVEVFGALVPEIHRVVPNPDDKIRITRCSGGLTTGWYFSAIEFSIDNFCSDGGVWIVHKPTNAVTKEFVQDWVRRYCSGEMLDSPCPLGNVRDVTFYETGLCFRVPISQANFLEFLKAHETLPHSPQTH